MRLVVVMAALLIALGGCSGQPAASNGIEISDAWARTSPMVAQAGAVYLRVANPGTAEDALTAATVESSVAARAEIHETVAVESAMGEATMMEMRPVDRITIPAGQTVMLEPGGYHIMLMDLAAPLEEGQQVELTLTFERAGEIEVTANVQETAP